MQGLADAIGNGCNINLRCKFKSDTISVAGLLCLGAYLGLRGYRLPDTVTADTVTRRGDRQ